MRRNPVVAIDGPSGVGKSTVAKGVAAQLQFQFVDTGALYRAVALAAYKNGINWEDGNAVAREAETHSFCFDSSGNLAMDDVFVGDSIRTPHMSEGASTVAKHPEVRAALLDIQRQLGKDGGVVLEGRDIGTVVFPDAEKKFFLTASIRERARRRHLQLLEKGENVTIEEIEKAQVVRDERDSNRAVSPLKKADDALEVDCETKSADEVIQLITYSVVSSH
ncbi:MAG: (d)CMP kinase [Deltaproteobacteria bacterium]|nr:(d)CMP kinase [Deltaproteobacteria bacterium]MBN2671660.1 (d)CMP kinase [Deltaproteobacteria bacterium]